MEQSFLATLTVTVDVGAVVTAKRGDIEVSALCTTGQVTLELPAEGAWTVTATRGVAQYNSVVVTVSASYTASLTAEVHLEYFGTVTPLYERRSSIGAAAVEKHALFAGGGSYNNAYIGIVEGYKSDLTHFYADGLPVRASHISGAATNGIILFAGGLTPSPISNVTTYGIDLEKSSAENLSRGRYDIAGESIGDYALFGGGIYTSAVVDAYDSALTHTTPSVLVHAGPHSAASNDNYSMFCSNDESAQISAYNAELTREIPAAPQQAFYTAAQAGNYVVFAGGSNSFADDMANAYDLFLVRSIIEAPGENSFFSAATVKGNAIFYNENGVVIYDAFLTRTVVAHKSDMRERVAGTAIDEFALFAGGDHQNTYYNTVDAYRYV